MQALGRKLLTVAGVIILVAADAASGIAIGMQRSGQEARKEEPASAKEETQEVSHIAVGIPEAVSLNAAVPEMPTEATDSALAQQDPYEAFDAASDEPFVSQEPDIPEEEPAVTQPGQEHAGNVLQGQLTQPSQTPQENSAKEDFAAQVLQLVNEQRMQAGAGELHTNTAVQTAARARAVELAEQPSHLRPDGSSCFTALDEQGIAYVEAGENIAWGQQTPQEVVQSWMNSSGHRENILKESYTTVGIAYYMGEDGTYYWVQMFVQE